MRIVALLADRVKFFNGKNRFFLLFTAIAACLTALAIGIPRFVLERSAAHGVNPTGSKPQGCCNIPASLRRMIGTYYTTEDNFKSTLVLNNKGPHQIVVTPILHGKNGETHQAPPVSVGGESSYEVDLNAIAESAGSKFRSGGVEFTYTGRMMEMGGGLRIVNAEKSLIFDEQFLEPSMKFSSPQLEAVYAIPFEGTRVSVIVTNVTEKPLTVNGIATFASDKNQRSIQGQLKPYETEIINLPHGQTKEAAAGAVSLTHNGGKGALMAMIHVQDSDRGYSESVNFHDPAQGKTNQWHGAGLRLGSVNNDALRPSIAVRNIGKDTTSVAASVPYSKQDGKTGKISLPPLSLAPGEIRLFDTSNSQLRLRDFATAGLEIEYKGAPGSVIATANSISQSGNQVFALPLKDPQGGMSSTGGYPWFIKGSATTMVFIKNVTNESREFILEIVYQGGRWGSKRKLTAYQTLALDVRAIRDSQEKDPDGDVIPPEAASGHISWGVLGGKNKELIGRAQTVDIAKGMNSSYECQCICPPVFGEARLLPGAVSGTPGSTQQFTAQERFYNCFNVYGDWYNVSLNRITFSSDNPGVATLNSSGFGTAIAPGSTYLRASWESDNWVWDNEVGWCFFYAAAAACAAFCEVQCSIPTSEDTIPTNWDTLKPTQHKFTQRLFPITTNFSGRRIYEEDPGGYGPDADNCYYEGSGQVPFYKVTNPPSWYWTVAQGTNEWGPDQIGYSVDAVQFYQDQNKEPCSTLFQQRMLINCGSQRNQYVINYIAATINKVSGQRKIAVRRAEEIVEKNYR
jgi:hypothetical protein